MNVIGLTSFVLLVDDEISVDNTGVKKLRVRVTQCPPSIQTNMSQNKEPDLD